MSDTQFLELLDHIGVEPSHYHDPKSGEIAEHPSAGELGPLVSEGCAYAVPTMVGKEIVQTTRHVKILPSDEPISDKPKPVADDSEVTTTARIIPGTRTIETNDPMLVGVLQQGGYQLVDPPKSQHVARGRGASGNAENKGA
jgi:hypothetical protein